jgi:ABC-type transport system involved in multi-copper enzyme maturation permease subunit
MIATIANLAGWELYKLRGRWMLWILLAFAILFAQLALWGQFFSYQSLRDNGGQITVPAVQQQGAPRTVACNDLLSTDPARQPAGIEAQVAAGLAAQCRQQAAVLPARLATSYQGFTLPGSIPGALGIVQTLALILIAILAASAIGIDYGSGTLRSVLSKGTGRWPYLLAKILTLAGLAALGLAVTLVTVVASSAVAASLAGAAPGATTVAAATWSDAGIALWKAWTSTVPYLALTTFVTVLARSSAAGMAIGLGYYVLEQILIALLSGLFSWFHNVADFLLVRNITAWTQAAGGATAFGAVGTLPDSTHALVVLAGYAVVLGAAAFWIFERRDVHGATAG